MCVFDVCVCVRRTYLHVEEEGGDDAGVADHDRQLLEQILERGHLLHLLPVKSKRVCIKRVCVCSVGVCVQWVCVCKACVCVCV